jgi:hypothetical protein
MQFAISHCRVHPLQSCRYVTFKRDNLKTCLAGYTRLGKGIQYVMNIKNLNSVTLVRERTIPTERQPLFGEVKANFLRIEGVAWSAQQIPTVVNLGFLDRSRYFFLRVAPQLSSRGRVDPVPG